METSVRLICFIVFPSEDGKSEKREEVGGSKEKQPRKTPRDKLSRDTKISSVDADNYTQI